MMDIVKARLCRILRDGLSGSAVVLLTVVCAPVSAEVSLETRLSAGESDNINFAPDGGNRLEETIQMVSTAFVVDGETARTTTSFFGNYQFFHYLEETYEDEAVGGSRLNFVARLVPDRVRWRVTDDFGQAYIDPLEDITPGNRRDVHVFRTGPDFSLPIGERTDVDIQLLASTTNIEDSNADSDQEFAQLVFTRAHNVRWSSNYGASVRDIQYQEVSGVDYENRYLFVGFVAQGARTRWVTTVGKNQVKGQQVNADGTRMDVSFERQLSTRGSVEVSYGRRYSDAGSFFRFINGNSLVISETDDIFAATDPFESRSGFVTYTRAGPTMEWTLQGYVRGDSYVTQSDLDRNEEGVRFLLAKELTSRWDFSAYGFAVRRNFKSLDEEDRTRIYAFELARRLGRKLSVGIRGQYVERDVARQFGDRSERRYFLFFTYQRPTGGSTRSEAERGLDTF
jgi:hypothetical protein